MTPMLQISHEWLYPKWWMISGAFPIKSNVDTLFSIWAVLVISSKPSHQLTHVHWSASYIFDAIHAVCKTCESKICNLDIIKFGWMIWFEQYIFRLNHCISFKKHYEYILAMHQQHPEIVYQSNVQRLVLPWCLDVLLHVCANML